MRKFLIGFLCLVGAARGSDFVQYDPNSFVITNRVTGYLLSANTPEYLGRVGYLQVTNRAEQSGPGVTTSNLVGWCVVDGGWVRLMTQAEVDRIAATNSILASNAVLEAKIVARQIASNVVAATDGMSLYLRCTAEVNWYLINEIRTNAGWPALTKGTYKAMIETNINTIGQ